MKTMRESFEENYMAVDVPANNKKGFKIEYRYIGNWYIFGKDTDQLKKMKKSVGNFTLTSLVLYLAAGLQNSPLNYSRYIELFATLALAAFIFQVIGAVQFCISGERVTNTTFRDIRNKLTVAPAVFGALLVVASGMGFVEVAAGGPDGFAFLIPLCYCLSGLLSLAVTYWFYRLPYHVEKNAAGADGCKNGHGAAGKKKKEN